MHRISNWETILLKVVWELLKLQICSVRFLRICNLGMAVTCRDHNRPHCRAQLGRQHNITKVKLFKMSVPIKPDTYVSMVCSMEVHCFELQQPSCCIDVAVGIYVLH